MENLRLIIIIATIVFFVAGMITKKVSTIIALPAMGISVALIASFGLVEGDILAWNAHANVFGTIDETTGEVMVQQGIMTGVIAEGTKMMSGAIVSAIFGGALAVILHKLGVVEEIVKKVAELAGDKPMALAILFFAVTAVIFSAIGGLGPVILIGSIALPIMMSAGIKPRDAAAVVLLGLSAGGVINPANWATFTAILAGTGMSEAESYALVASSSYLIMAIVCVISLAFIVFAIKTTSHNRAWAVQVNNKPKKVSNLLLITPLIPIVLIFTTKVMQTFDPTVELMTPEVAIFIAIIWALLTSRAKNKSSLLTSSFIEGTQQVSGAIILLIGLGILIKGFQYYTVAPLIMPFTETLVSYLSNPWLYVIGFTLATPLVLYRGPLNTFGIGGSIPAIFAAAGFSPMATIYALRAVGNMQGFGDPTNSHNIWIADFVKVDPNDITKRLFVLGFIMSFAILLVGVITNPGMLG